MNQGTAAAALVDVATLGTLLGAPQLAILDCRFDLARPEWGAAQYRSGHIPGARHADLNRDLSAPVTAATGRHPLPDPAAFAATLGRWGITAGSEVVCYDQGSGAFAARAWWLLRARGQARVRVLDGGYAAWLEAGGATETGAPQAAAATAPVRAFAGVVDTGEVAAGLAAGTLLLVDARAADRYAGRNETIDPVAGHVPGAVNHPFMSNLGPDGRFLAPAQLRAAWAPLLAGRDPARLAMMCGSGVTACHNLLALAAAGIQGPRLYAGSFSEWIRDPARPVATGESQKS
ncbi:MAG: sulfurtransferase [Steroidobacteraceae bacterium]